MAIQPIPATASGAIEYLDSLVKKGRAISEVVSPLKSAVTKVLQKTEGDTWGDTDLLDVDVSDIMWRFKLLTPNEYSEGSYRTYEMRLKKAIEWYVNFRRTPGWMPPQPSRANSADTSRLLVTPTATVPAVQEQAPATGSTDEDEALMYPFPLASGKTAQLLIPKNILADDIERLKRFLDAIVIRKEKHETSP